MPEKQGVQTARKICIRLLPPTMKVGALQEILAKEGFECHKQYELLYYVQGSQLSLSFSRCYLSVKEDDIVKQLVKVFDRKSLPNASQKISVILSPYQMISESIPNRSSSIEEDPDYKLFLENETTSLASPEDPMENQNMPEEPDDEDSSLFKFLDEVTATLRPVQDHSDKWMVLYKKKRKEILARESVPKKKGRRSAWRREVNRRAAEYADHAIEQTENSSDSPSESHDENTNARSVAKGNQGIRIHTSLPGKSSSVQTPVKSTPVQLSAKPAPVQPSTKPAPAKPGPKAGISIGLPLSQPPARLNQSPPPVKQQSESCPQPSLLPKPGTKQSLRVVKPGVKSNPASKSRVVTTPTKIVVAAKPKRSRKE